MNEQATERRAVEVGQPYEINDKGRRGARVDLTQRIINALRRVDSGRGDYNYCRPACRDARVPPLESKPAEMLLAPNPDAANDERLKAWSAAQSGTPYAGPERMQRPKLAHVAGLSDDELVTW